MDTPLPPSAVALSEIIDSGDDVAKLIKERFDRSVLWRWRHGKAIPDLDSATFLHRETEGRIDLNGWVIEPKTAPASRQATGTEGR